MMIMMIHNDFSMIEKEEEDNKTYYILVLYNQPNTIVATAVLHCISSTASWVIDT